MKANPYDWLKQSREHRAFGNRNYPVMAGVASRSNGYPSFALQIQGLPGDLQAEYLHEWGSWYDKFGKSWNRIGCIKEQRLGQYTEKFKERDWTPGLGQISSGTPLRRGSRHMLGAFDTSVGNNSGRPSPPYGYKSFPSPPESNITWTGPWIAVPGHLLWISRPAQVKGYKGVSYVYMRSDQTDVFLVSQGKEAAPKPKKSAPATPTAPSPAVAPETPITPVEPEKAGVSPWVLFLLGGAAIAFGMKFLGPKKGKR